MFWLDLQLQFQTKSIENEILKKERQMKMLENKVSKLIFLMRTWLADVKYVILGWTNSCGTSW